MDKGKIRVLISNDDRKFCNSIRNCLSKQEDIQVIGVAYNMIDTYCKTKELNPDVVVMFDDVVLKIDNVVTRESQSKDKDLKRRNRLVQFIVTAIETENIKNGCGSHSSKNYSEKQFDLYIRNILLQIRKAKEVVVSEKDKNKSILIDNNKFDKREIEARITRILHELGVPVHVRGYRYMKVAIIAAIKNVEILNHITKGLYPFIAKKCNAAPHQVERDIRYAIEIAWRLGKMDSIYNVFGSGIKRYKGKPTNGECIALISEKIRMELKTSYEGTVS